MKQDSDLDMTGRSLLRRAALAAIAGIFVSTVSLHAAAQEAPSSLSLPAGAAVAAVEPAARPHYADFGQEAASPDVRELADWVVATADNRSLPFMIIDKVQARVFGFDPKGALRGAASALLGTAIGDDSVPGIGERKLSSIRPHERTTAAGRFVAYLDRDIHGEEILWVDYDTSLSLHRIITTNPKERRAQRLASPSPTDNRITYGCINVSVAFYEGVVSPLFTRTQGIVYILPETRPATVVFGSHPVKVPPPQLQATVAAPVTDPAPR